MCRSTLTRTLMVANREGLHLRAATMIADLARRHRAEVKVVKGSDRVDAIDVLQVVSLGTLEGEKLLFEASGEDAEAVLEALERLFANQFENEQPRSDHP